LVLFKLSAFFAQDDKRAEKKGEKTALKTKVRALGTSISL